jgi:hypothetical protein
LKLKSSNKIAKNEYTDFEFSLPESKIEIKESGKKRDFFFSLPQSKKKINLKRKIKKIIKAQVMINAPLYYVLSLFCFERQFNGVELPIVDFAYKIFGKNSDSKFLKEFMPSLLPRQTKNVKKNTNNYNLVSNI